MNKRSKDLAKDCQNQDLDLEITTKQASQNTNKTALNSGSAHDLYCDLKKDQRSENSHDPCLEISDNTEKDRSSDLDNTKDNSKDLKHNQAHESASNELDSAKRYLAENQKLRKHNHEQAIELNERKRQVEQLESECQSKNNTLTNVDTLAVKFFAGLRKILPDQAISIAKDFTFGLANGSIKTLDNAFNELSNIIGTLIDCRQAANLSALNLSKSERSNSAAPIIKVLDRDADKPEDSFTTQSSSTKQNQKNSLSKGSAEKEFGHNCKLVKEIHDEIIEKSDFGRELKEYQEANPLSNQQYQLGDSRKAHKINQDSLFSLIKQYVIPHCLDKHSGDNKSSKSQDKSKHVDNRETVKQIENTNFVIHAITNTFNGYCKHCNQYTKLKITDIKQYNTVNGTCFGRGFHSSANPSYHIECPCCHERYSMSMIDMNVPKSVLASCTDYSKKDSLVLPKDTKAKSSGGEESLDNENTSFQDNFTPKNALSRLDKAPDNQRYTVIQSELGKRASDIKNQPHTCASIFENFTDLSYIKPLELFPVFKGSSISIGLFTEALAATRDYTSTSRFHKSKVSQAVEQYIISRSRLMEVMPIFSRAFLKGVAEQIHQDIIASADVVGCDETHTAVVEAGKINGARSKKCYIWGMCSIDVCGDTKVYYEAHDNRTAQACMSLIDYNSDEAVFKAVITDGYRVYINVFESMDGKKRVHACCFAHWRRIYRQYLIERDWLSLYDQLLTTSSNTEEFFSNLEEMVLKGPKDDYSNFILALTIYHIINQLFVNDANLLASLKGHERSEILKALDKMRKEDSAYLLAVLNVLVEANIAINDNIKVSKKGKTYQANKCMCKNTEFCLYWMNYRQYFTEFINMPEIPLSNNDMERAFRLPAILKRVKLSIKTMDGFHAFADQLTVIENCTLAGVDIRYYIPWLVINVQRAINNLSNDEIKQASDYANKLWPNNAKKIELQKNRMPKKFEAETINDKGVVVKTTLDLYDPSNPTAALYDLISFKGLTPHDFKREMEKMERQRLAS